MVPSLRAVVVTEGGADRVSIVAAEIGPDADRFAVRWADAGDSEERSDPRWHPLTGPVGPAVRGHEDVRSTDGGAAACSDAADRCQGSSSSGAPQVVPLRASVLSWRSRLIPSRGTSCRWNRRCRPGLDTPAGSVSGVQTPPPFVVVRIAAPGPVDEEPTALQSCGSGHEIAAKLVMVAGICSAVQVVPPLTVRMMLGAPSPESKSLTAWQIEAIDAGDGGEFTDSCRYIGFGRPDRPPIGRTDDDGAAENAESHGGAVGGSLGTRFRSGRSRLKESTALLQA